MSLMYNKIFFQYFLFEKMFSIKAKILLDNIILHVMTAKAETFLENSPFSIYVLCILNYSKRN